MGSTYYIYATRMQGWVLRSGAYGTSLDQARIFTREEAVAWARKHVDHNGAMLQFPVETSLIHEIVGAAS